MTQRAIKQLAKRVLPSALIRSARRLRKAGIRGSIDGGETAEVRSIERTNTPEVDHLEDRLWLGYETAARTELTSITRSAHLDSSVKLRARLALARWLAYRGEFESALGFLDVPNSEWGPLEREAGSLSADCLCHMGRVQAALSRLAPLVHRQAVDSSTRLRLGGARALAEDDTGHGSGPFIAALNHIYARRHFVQLRRDDFSVPVGLANVTANAPAHEPSEASVLVSAIVPITDETDTIRMATESLCAQSWKNLEVLLVGAFADLDLVDVTTQLAEADSRIRPIDVPGARGQNRLKNVGLDSASGELITVSGGGEWSHPQRIELLASTLTSDPSLQATGTFFVEIGEDMLPRWINARSVSSLVGRNASSLMIRRSAFEELGGWDEVPFRTDEEFIGRIEARFGFDSTEWLEPDVPLSVVVAPPSDPARPLAARTTETLHILEPASRYQDAFKWWHASPDFRSNLPYWPQQGRRPFAATDEWNGEEEIHEIDYDLLVIGDLEEGNRHTEELVQLIEKYPGDVGHLHIPSFHSPERRILPAIQSLAASGKVSVLGREVPIRCRSVIISPSVLASPPFDGLPEIAVESAYALTSSRKPNPEKSAATSAALEAWLGIPIATVDGIDATHLGATSWD